MQKYRIPCARSVSFSSYEEAKAYIEKQTPPLVVKADGLAAGKGVTVARTIPEALETLSKMMRARVFGAAGDSVVVEECLTGSEMSAFAMSDGKNVINLASACDYKPVFDGNRGPNTGGMGSYSPPYFATPELDKAVMETIMKPTVRAMAQEKIPYRSVLYGGLMITRDGPEALEFNARFGDPETQVVLPRLKSDLMDIILAVINGGLDRVRVEMSSDACVGVVMASGGYPDSYRTGFPISGLDRLDRDILVFHAGTKTGTTPGEVLTSGGRVLTVVATGKTIAEAREKVYSNIGRIHFEGCHYRRDIALFNKE